MNFASMFYSRTVALVASVCFATITSQGHAAIINLQEDVSPTGSYVHDDTTIRNDTGTPVGSLPSGASGGLLVGSGATGGLYRGLVEFNLSSIIPTLGTDTISNVSFTLWLSTHNASGLPRVENIHTTSPSDIGNPKIDIRTYGFDVDPAVATWNSPAVGDSTPGGNISGGLLGTFGNITSAGGYKHTISGPALVAAVNGAIAGDGFFRMIILEDSPDAITRDLAFFRSSDVDLTTPNLVARPGSSSPTGTGPANYHPLLTIETIPEPSTYAFAGLALVGLGLVGLRKRKQA